MGGRIGLFVTHLIGDALLLGLGYWWLGSSESDTAHLLLSGMTVVLFLACAAWLQGLTLASFCGLSYGRAAVRAVRSLPALLVLALLAFAVYSFLDWASLHYGRTAYVIGSYATMRTRKPVAPTTVALVFRYVTAICRWVILPALLLPLAAAIAVRGWSGWRLSSLRRKRAWLYWMEVAALLLCAIWLPFRLFFWVPAIESFGGQMASFVLRIGAGYLLFVVGVIAVEFCTASGSPFSIQPSTVASP